MKQIRSNVFETNSSSSHSICVAWDKEGIIDTIAPDKDGVIVLSGGTFGRETEIYYDAITKANYCAVDYHDDPTMLQMLIEVIKEHTGASEVRLHITTDYRSANFSYIDHQSQGTCNNFLDDKESLKSFIFNPASYLQTCND